MMRCARTLVAASEKIVRARKDVTFFPLSHRNGRGLCNFLHDGLLEISSFFLHSCVIYYCRVMAELP